MKHPLDAAGFARLTGAAPAAVDRMAALASILCRWQRRINLVGAASLQDYWRRHALDSAQLLPLLPPPPGTVADLGAGAGFPGLVLAILGERPVTLVESDKRKCAFLAEAARAVAAEVEIRPMRLESAAPRSFTVVTARALAPLPRLLGYAAAWLAPDGICLFLKGRALVSELTAATETWSMRTTTIPSLSDADGAVLKVEQLRERA